MGWTLTEHTCSTYSEFVDRASSGELDPGNWLFAQHNHGKKKVVDFGESEAICWSTNTWKCKSHGDGKLKGDKCCHAQVSITCASCYLVYNKMYFSCRR